MKNILLASTALVATAGVAAADVALSGDARVGVVYIDGAADETFVTNRFTLNIDASAVADNGLEMGARVRIRQDTAGELPTITTFDEAVGDQTRVNDGINGARIYMRAGGLEFAAGNIYGAMDSLAGLYAGSIGLTGLGWGNVVTNFASHGYSSQNLGAGPEGVEATYTIGSVGLHASHAADRTELAATFKAGAYTIGAAIADQDDTDGQTDWLLTAGGNLGNFGVGLALADIDGNMNATLSGSFAVGAATTVVAYVAKDEGQAEETAYGLGVVHNMGGGVELKGGVVDLHGQTRADLGINFKF